jgi:hypothetical protein
MKTTRLIRLAVAGLMGVAAVLGVTSLALADNGPHGGVLGNNGFMRRLSSGAYGQGIEIAHHGKFAGTLYDVPRVQWRGADQRCRRPNEDERSRTEGRGIHQCFHGHGADRSAIV